METENNTMTFHRATRGIKGCARWQTWRIPPQSSIGLLQHSLMNQNSKKKKTYTQLRLYLKSCFTCVVLLEQIFGTSPRWSEPIWTESILCPLTLLGKPDELRATEKVMTRALLCAGLIIKAASVGIGPRVSGSALQSSNTTGTPRPTPPHRINWWYSVEDKWN